MPNEAPKTLIAEDIEISGSVKCASHIQFDGKLNGDLTCTGNALIGATANIKGNVSAESTTILGQVTGNISARDRVELKTSARVNGDIKAKRMTVEDGVTLIGKSDVNPTGAAMTRPPEQRPDALDTPRPPEEKPAREEKSGGLFGRR